MALGLKIVVDRHADRSGGGVEISFFLVIMWWLFLVDVAVVGGVFGGLNFVLFCFFFFLCGDYFLWLWLVVDLVILVVGFLVDVVC